MVLPPIPSPAGLWRDLRGFLRARTRHELIFAGLSLSVPMFLVFAFMFDVETVVYKPPIVIFVKDWNKGRTLAEIKKQQAIDQPAERAARKEEAEFEAKKQKQFKDLQKALHL